jgi:hypothetical protein
MAAMRWGPMLRSDHESLWTTSLCEVLISVTREPPEEKSMETSHACAFLLVLLSCKW